MTEKMTTAETIDGNGQAILHCVLVSSNIGSDEERKDDNNVSKFSRWTGHLIATRSPYHCGERWDGHELLPAVISVINFAVVCLMQSPPLPLLGSLQPSLLKLLVALPLNRSKEHGNQDLWKSETARIMRFCAACRFFSSNKSGSLDGDEDLRGTFTGEEKVTVLCANDLSIMVNEGNND